MELVFYELLSETELLRCDLFLEEDGEKQFDWPFLPREGEYISLTHGKGETINGNVEAISWTSVGGFLNAVSIYIKPT